MEGLEPAHLSAPDPKSGVSTNFTTSAIYVNLMPFAQDPVGAAKIRKKSILQKLKQKKLGIIVLFFAAENVFLS